MNAPRADLRWLWTGERVNDKIDCMWLPTPSAQAVAKLRVLTESRMPTDLTDDQWVDLATRLLRIYYIKMYVLGGSRTEGAGTD